MLSDDNQVNVLLGIGGSQPGTARLLPSHDVLRVLTLPQGHSVYALDTDLAGTIAAGSRAGEVHVVRKDGQFSLEQGAPVLAVSFFGDSWLASSDTHRRCLLWAPLGEFASQRHLDTGDDNICSLLSFSESRLIGLSCSGKLLSWEVHAGELTDSVTCPEPPAKSALVRLLQWPGRDVVVFPAAEGQVAVMSIGAKGVSAWPAHKGEAYAVFFVEDVLCTAGMDDGVMRTWDITGKVLDEWSIPKGIIAGCQASQAGDMLLIDRGGKAQFYHRQPGGLKVGRNCLEPAIAL